MGNWNFVFPGWRASICALTGVQYLGCSVGFNSHQCLHAGVVDGGRIRQGLPRDVGPVTAMGLCSEGDDASHTVPEFVESHGGQRPDGAREYNCVWNDVGCSWTCTRPSILSSQLSLSSRYVVLRNKSIQGGCNCSLDCHAV